MRRTWPALIPLGLGLVVSVLVVAFELAPGQRGAPTVLGLTYDADFNEAILLAICGAVAIGLFAWPLVSRWRRGRRVGLVALALATCLAGFCYLYGARGVARSDFGKWHDSFHYVLGAKYFTELGYFSFYDCAAAAHLENGARLSPGQKIRDLRTYKLITVAEATARTDCEAMFSEARWQAFRSDVALFNRYKSISRVLLDHGYNGSPVHTFFAARLANAVGLDYASVTALSLIDIVVIALMLSAVIAAFGWRLGFLFAILFFVNFSDRFYFIGGSMMRYVWMAALTIGIAALKARRYRTAGALMTTAALLNVFPVLFMVGMLARVIWTTIATRRVAPRYRHYIAACAVTGVIGLGIGASHSQGAKNYTEFLSFIGSHSQKLTSSRTGLRYVVLERGAPAPGAKPVGYRTKGKQLRQAAPVLFAIGGALIGIGLLLCSRLDDASAAALFGLILFYVVFGTVEYYWAVTPLLLFAFHRRARDGLGAIVLGAVFAAMTAVLILWRATGSLQFGNNTAMSAALLSFISLTLVYLADEVGLVRWRRTTLAAAATAAILSGPLVVLLAWWFFA